MFICIITYRMRNYQQYRIDNNVWIHEWNGAQLPGKITVHGDLRYWRAFTKLNWTFYRVKWYILETPNGFKPRATRGANAYIFTIYLNPICFFHAPCYTIFTLHDRPILLPTKKNGQQPKRTRNKLSGYDRNREKPLQQTSIYTQHNRITTQRHPEEPDVEWLIFWQMLPPPERSCASPIPISHCTKKSSTPAPHV